MTASTTQNEYPNATTLHPPVTNTTPMPHPVSFDAFVLLFSPSVLLPLAPSLHLNSFPSYKCSRHHFHFTQQPNPCFSSYSFLPRMDSFNSAPFPATTIDPSNTTTQQNMGHPQNVNFPDNSGQQQPLLFPATPYSLPPYDYDPNLQSFPYMHTSSSFPPVNNQPLYGCPNLYSFPMGQSGGGGVPLSRMQDSQVLLQQSEEDRNKMVEAQRCRIARERRRQARQRSRNSHASSVSPSVLEETVRQQQPPTLITSPDQSNVTVFTTQYTLSPCVFHAPDGKVIVALFYSDINAFLHSFTWNLITILVFEVFFFLTSSPLTEARRNSDEEVKKQRC